jgi:phosphate ABC transporter permease subunit PstA
MPNRTKTAGKRTVKGEPWVWLSGGAVATGIVMILGMLVLITVEGTAAFWPYDIEAFVMGKARFHIQHPQQGPAFVAQDDSMIVVPARGDAWRSPDGAVAAGAESPEPATLKLYAAQARLFEGRDWLIRRPDGGLLLDLKGHAVTPSEFTAGPAKYLTADESDAIESVTTSWGLEDPKRGAVYVTKAGKLVFPVAWKQLDGTPVPFDFPTPRTATVADYRALPALFGNVEWLLADTGDTVVMDAEARPVTAAAYLANPAKYPSPWGYYDEQGSHVPIETLLGDDKWRDYTLLVGAVRGQRPMDIRILPPNADGTPVKPYQLDEAPSELLVRQGNQGKGLYNDDAYFRWVRVDVPDPEAMKHHRLSSYDEIVLTRAPLPGAVLVERLEKGVLSGYITRVTAKGEVLADIKVDGREKTWEVFQAEHEKMRTLFLERYDIEKNALGRVNFELKDREDALKLIRYENRDSRNVFTAMEVLVEAHQKWQSAEPLPDPALTEEEYQDRLDAWLKDLAPILDAWMDAAIGLDLQEAEKTALDRARDIEEQRAEIQALEFGILRFRVVSMRAAEAGATYDFQTSDGATATLVLSEVVRAFRPNESGLFGKLGIYADRVWEFLTDDPRESNTEGGVWPVILGTLVMTLLMCVAVVPFGVIAALYLREYAKQGPVVSTVRIAVNNLAGVPSIVFGIFGLGFFCVVMGGSIDSLFFPELQPAPVFGGGGIMWAALTLALLTVPVVIVSTEEALSAVPSSQREASLACGASKWQTITKVVLPQALPGVLTGTILAMARGAGEVAPLMLVGAVKYAPYAPVDSVPPLVHLERKFMHLGFHIYDVGFQSPNVDNTKPLVFATALVLIVMVAVLNIFAIKMRNRLRKKFATSAV